MSITRSQLGRGPAIVTLNGATLFMRDDFLPKHSPVWKPANTTHLGQVDQYKEDFVIKLPVMVFGLWQSLSAMFPSYLMNPVVGTNIFGTADNPFVVLAKDGSRITYPNAQVTKMMDLYLGIGSELFAAALEVTCLIKNGANPEDAGAYFTRDSAAYSETTFSLANFKKTRWTGAWGTVTGFGAMVPQKGVNISWKADLQPDPIEGLGTVSMYIGQGGMTANTKCVPIGPTAAQVDAAQNVGTAHGSLLSAGAADLTWTGASGGSVVLKGAGIVSSQGGFGIKPLRVNEVEWETTRAITAGAVGAVATIS